MHVIRFSGNERLSERLSWRLFGRLRRKRIGRLKTVREVREGGFVTSDGEATETTRMRPERRETDWKRRSYGENYRRHGSQLDSACKLSTSLTNILATWSVRAGDPILRS